MAMFPATRDGSAGSSYQMETAQRAMIWAASLLICLGDALNCQKKLHCHLPLFQSSNTQRQGGDRVRQGIITFLFLIPLNTNKGTTAMHIPCAQILLHTHSESQTLPPIFPFHWQVNVLHVTDCSGWQEKLTTKPEKGLDWVKTDGGLF